MRRFLIPTLLAAGFGPTDPLQAALTGAATTDRDDPNQAKLLQQFRQDHLYTLAGHSSHRSHSSHSSHRSGGGGHSSHYSHTSHRSSTGGYTAPVYTPAPSYAPPSSGSQSSDSGSSGSSGSPSGSTSSLYSDPPAATSDDTSLKTLGGRSKLFKIIVLQVQVALMGRGLFNGPVDGDVGPKTRSALRVFQGSAGLPVTGTITPQTLDALHVPSQQP